MLNHSCQSRWQGAIFLLVWTLLFSHSPAFGEVAMSITPTGFGRTLPDAGRMGPETQVSSLPAHHSSEREVLFLRKRRVASGGLRVYPIRAEDKKQALKLKKLAQAFLREDWRVRELLGRIPGVRLEVYVCAAVTSQTRYFGACTSLEPDATGRKMVVYLPLFNRRGLIPYQAPVAPDSDAFVAGATFTYLERIFTHELAHVYVESLPLRQKRLLLEKAEQYLDSLDRQMKVAAEQVSPASSFTSPYATRSSLEFLTESLCFWVLNPRYLREAAPVVADWLEPSFHSPF